MSFLSGKNALITGGSRGIGAQIARDIAKNGANVIITYNNNESEAEKVITDIKSYGVNGYAIKADISKTKEIDELFAQIDKIFNAQSEEKYLDILINNAGYGSDGQDCRFGRETEEHFDKVFAINVKGTFFVSQGAAGRIKDGGRIINIGSVSGRVAQPFSPAYGMTKRAVASLTESMAAALGKHQISVNLIAPGAVDTDFIAALKAKPGFVENASKAVSFGRIGKADDISGAVMMLLQPNTGWITGQSIEAAGGFYL